MAKGNKKRGEEMRKIMRNERRPVSGGICAECGHSFGMHIDSRGGCWQETAKDADGRIWLCRCAQYKA